MLILVGASQTHCDPRLNYEQSLDIAFLLSHSLRARRLGRSSNSPPMSHDASVSHTPLQMTDSVASLADLAQLGGRQAGYDKEEESLLNELVRGIKARE